MQPFDTTAAFERLQQERTATALPTPIAIELKCMARVARA